MGKKKCRFCKVRPANRNRSNHHLRPKWGNGDTSRRKKKDSCIGCHQNIHMLFSNKELYEKYNTVEKLRAELQRRLMLEALANMVLIEKMVEEGPVAQLEEQESCKLQVGGSTPLRASYDGSYGVNGNISGCQPEDSGFESRCDRMAL